ncbi:UvrD-helicase domain-containing protein [Actinomadura keratinilytica]
MPATSAVSESGRRTPSARPSSSTGGHRWRALLPGHRPHSDGAARCRHLTTEGRTVTALHDEILDLGDERRTGHEDPNGDAVLLAALGAARTGRMADIVQTIQAEQDRIIRAPHQGVLVVEGGPGTGKTAVALHRAAYLLYAHREQLARRAVLIVGPNPAFLGYIGEVLPSLGETGVWLATLGELFPGVEAKGTDTPAPPRSRAAWRRPRRWPGPSPTGRPCRTRCWRSTTTTTAPSTSTAPWPPRPASGPAPPACRTTWPGRTSPSGSSTPSPPSSPTASAPTPTAAPTSWTPPTSPSSPRRSPPAPRCTPPSARSGPS